MSALVFVRDGRTLPFVPVTIVAMEAVRAATPKRRPYAVTTYLALLEFANENRADRVALSQREIVERVGASRSTVQTALADLQEAGVLVVNERIHGNARIENEYVIVEPSGDRATSGTPARDTGDPRPSGKQRSLEGKKEEPTASRAHAKPKPDPNALPDGFPDSMLEPLESVMRSLTFVAESRGAPAPARASVARAMMKPERARKPFASVAEKVEHWSVYGKGQSVQCKDVVARWRDWCDNEPDHAPVTAVAGGANVHQFRPKRGGTPWSAADMIALTREGA
jgi:DNA-binding Lrp family transcriptional regulator